jgi:single-strand DNA-binding protein
MNVNKVTLGGRLTRDVELRYTPNQTAVADFGLAINRKYKDKEDTCYIDLTAWGKTAEIIQKYFKKGSEILIFGFLTFEQWKAQDGSKRSKLKVTVESFEFVGSANKGNSGQAENESDREDYPNGDDIPF